MLLHKGFSPEPDLFVINEETRTITPTRTLKDKDFSLIRAYLIANQRKIIQGEFFVDFSNNLFSAGKADSIEEEAIVRIGIPYNQIKCDRTNQQHFVAFLKDRLFKTLKEKDNIEAASAITYIYRDFVTKSQSSGGPLPDDFGLTALATASKEEIKNFFNTNPNLAFRLYMWFHLHRSEAEQYYEWQSESKDPLNQEQSRQQKARWEEIRRDVFREKLDEIDKVDEGEQARLIGRFNNNTLEAVLLPYSVCFWADQVHALSQEHGTDKARAIVLSHYAAAYRETYELASKVTQDHEKRMQLTEASFMALHDYGRYAPANYARTAGGRAVAFVYFKDYLLPALNKKRNPTFQITPQILNKRLERIERNPQEVSFKTPNPGMEKSMVLNFTLETDPYEGRYSSLHNLADLVNVNANDIKKEQEKIEKGEETSSPRLVPVYTGFKQALKNIRAQWYWGDGLFYRSKREERERLQKLIEKMDKENPSIDFLAQLKLNDYIREAINILSTNEEEKETLNQFLRGKLLLPDNMAYDAAVICCYYSALDKLSALVNFFPEGVPKWSFQEWQEYFCDAENVSLASDIVGQLQNLESIDRSQISEGLKNDIELYYMEMLSGSTNDNQYMFDLSVRPFNLGQVREFLIEHPEIKRVKFNASLSAKAVLSIVKELAKGALLPRIDFSGNPYVNEATRVQIYKILDEHRLKNIAALKENIAALPEGNQKRGELKLIFDQYIYEHQAISLRSLLVELQKSLKQTDFQLGELIKALDSALETQSKIDNSFIQTQITAAEKCFQRLEREGRFQRWWQKELILKNNPMTSAQNEHVASIILFIYRDYFRESFNLIPERLRELRQFLPSEDENLEAFYTRISGQAQIKELAADLYQWFLLYRSQIEQYYREQRKDYSPYWQQVVTREYPRKFNEFKYSTGKEGDEGKNDLGSVTRAFNTGSLDTILIPDEILSTLKDAYRNIKSKLQTLKQAGDLDEDGAKKVFLEVTGDFFKVIAKTILSRLVVRVGGTDSAPVYLYQKFIADSLKLDQTTNQEQFLKLILSSCAGLFQFTYEAANDELSGDRFTQNFIYTLYTNTFEAAVKNKATPEEIIDYLREFTSESKKAPRITFIDYQKSLDLGKAVLFIYADYFRKHQQELSQQLEFELGSRREKDFYAFLPAIDESVDDYYRRLETRMNEDIERSEEVMFKIYQWFSRNYEKIPPEENDKDRLDRLGGIVSHAQTPREIIPYINKETIGVQTFILTKRWSDLVEGQKQGAQLSADNANIIDIFVAPPTPSILSRFMSWMRQPWTFFGLLGNKKETNRPALEMTYKAPDLSTQLVELAPVASSSIGGFNTGVGMSSKVSSKDTLGTDEESKSNDSEPEIKTQNNTRGIMQAFPSRERNLSLHKPIAISDDESYEEEDSQEEEDAPLLQQYGTKLSSKSKQQQQQDELLDKLMAAVKGEEQSGRLVGGEWRSRSNSSRSRRLSSIDGWRQDSSSLRV